MDVARNIWADIVMEEAMNIDYANFQDTVYEGFKPYGRLMGYATEQKLEHCLFCVSSRSRVVFILYLKS